MRALTLGIYVVCAVVSFGAGGGLVPAAAAQSASDTQEQMEPSPEEKMQRRFPQPVRVGDLIGLPVLDERDSTIGYVRQVVLTPAGKIELIVAYAKWFGWVRTEGNFNLGRRLVPVPLEVVAIMGRQLASLDMSREEFAGAPTWTPGLGTPISVDEMIQVAVGKR